MAVCIQMCVQAAHVQRVQYGGQASPPGSLRARRTTSLSDGRAFVEGRRDVGSVRLHCIIFVTILILNLNANQNVFNLFQILFSK